MSVGQKRFSVGKVFLHAALLFWAIFMILPFAWMILTSLKTRPESMKVPIIWFPAEPQWENYAIVLNKYNFGQHYLNTTIVTVTTVLFQVFTCSMGAYVFARLEFPGKRFLFM